MISSDQGVWVPGLAEKETNIETKEITPESFYFVKLIDMQGLKNFINMCGCSEVAAPGEWKDGVPPELEESFSLMESNADYDTQNLRFSLSCSDCIYSTDNQGKLCKVYDVVFNLEVMRHSMVHKQLKAFLINMAITWISQKYKVELNSDYKLPRGKYKGSQIRKHYIRTSKRQLVTEIYDANADMSPSFPLIINKPSQILQPQVVKDRDTDFVRQSPALPELFTGMHGSSENSSLSSLQKKIPLQHDDKTATPQNEDSLFCFPTCSLALHNHKGTPNNVCEIAPNANVVNSNNNKMNDESVHQGSSSSILSEQKSELSEIEDGSSCQVFEAYSAKPPLEQTPFIQTNFHGCPVELVILRIMLPSCLEDVKVWASKTEVLVEAHSYDPIKTSIQNHSVV
ncbi:hypothetical protein KP509_05G084100 [Ceratopteris richardii]|uniref:PIH1 N-terminal domain-containing protein n=1 Tax=Ceratopteris richardii TaxID=49495 RepID=A0A8T2UVA6_CERRI|nr:hypothetical protein KP509_05G084100 [Ceratopteris richardii]